MQMPQKNSSLGFLRNYLPFLALVAVTLYSDPIKQEIPVQEEHLIAYYDLPEESDSYPLMLVLEGSLSQEDGPVTVLRLHKKFASFCLSSKIGFITMERRGASEKTIDVARFHKFNFPSQRLADHLVLIEHLRASPPKGWNGKLFILGGSEGGPIAIKLSHLVNPDACIALVGCGDQPFKELIWNYMQQDAKSAYTTNEIFTQREEYEAHIKKMKEDPDPKKWWYGQTFRYWADALDQSEIQEVLELKCPLLVVAGSKDLEVASTDRLVEKARQLNKDLSYLRVEGMGHNILDPQWNVLNQVLNFLESEARIGS